MMKPDKIIRSNRKTLSVSVTALGELIVRAPMRLSEERIFAFLTEKQAWILRQKSKTAGAGSRLPTENLDGFRFLLLGEEYTVRLYDGARIVCRAEEKALFLPKTNSKERLVKWLKDNARRILTELTESYSARLNAPYRSIAITSAKSRWGSCSGENAIRYTFRLIYAPKAVVEYVVVHELCHVFEKNHSSAFWALVARSIPDWKTRRKWLKDNRFVMEIF